MPSPSGDALAAKLAELVGGYDITPFEWRDDVNATFDRDATVILRDLLAWVAEQGAASPMPDGAYQIADDVPVPATCTCRYANTPEESVRWADPNCRYHGAPASPMPATHGNRPVNARTGAAPSPEPSEGAESVNRAHRRDDDPAHDGTRRVHYPCGCYRFPDGMLAQASSCRLDHDAPAPDAALRAALERVLWWLEWRIIPVLDDAGLRDTARIARDERDALRAALSPDAPRGDA